MFFKLQGKILYLVNIIKQLYITIKLKIIKMKKLKIEGKAIKMSIDNKIVLLYRISKLIDLNWHTQKGMIHIKLMFDTYYTPKSKEYKKELLEDLNKYWNLIYTDYKNEIFKLSDNINELDYLELELLIETIETEIKLNNILI